MLSIKSKLGCFIGVQYFRPPNPPTKFWEKDIKNIRNLGFKVIRTWLYWSKVNPRPRKWDFNIYDRFVEIAHRNGLKVLIQLVPESPPQYILSKYSYAYYMNENGQIVKPYALGMVSIGGYPGLNPDMPEVRKLIEKFFIKTVSHYSEIDVHLYDVWNELMPHYRIPALLYNPSTQDRFRKWLKKKYGNIDSLNDAWGGSTYTDWSQIEMPLKGNYANMLDLHLFHRHWIREELKWRVKLVKKIDDEAICLSHAAGGLATVTKTPYNIWDLAEIVDIWGTSDYEIDFYRAALLHNLIRSSCNGGEWWLSEQTGGRTWTLFGEKHGSKTFIVQKMVQAISYGAKGNIIWQYRPEIFGQESPNFGLVFEDGTYTERTKAVSSLAKKLEKYSYIFDNLRFDKPDVGIVFDWRIRSLEYTAFNDPGKFSEKELFGWHSLLTDIGVDVSILSVENIVEKGIDKNIRLLIIPLLIQDMENIVEKLIKFVENGGYLFIGPYFLVYNEKLYVNSSIPPYKVFGFKRREIYYPDKINISTIINIDLKGWHLIETLELIDAEPIAYMGKHIVGVSKNIGSGKIYYIGTFLGHTYREENLQKFIEKILREASCRRFPKATNNIIVRKAYGGGGEILFLFNPTERSKNTKISIDKEAIEIVSDKKYKSKNGKLKIRLKQREAKILYIK